MRNASPRARSRRTPPGTTAGPASSSRRPRPAIAIQPLEPRTLLAAPTLAALPNVTLQAGAPLQIALDGNDADAADALTFTVTSNNANLTATVSPSTNRSLKIVASHASSGAGDAAFSNETMVLKLFEDKAPATTARIIQFAQAGFYNNLTFHRVLDAFMVQGGDPTGTGSGGTGTNIDDEFDPSLQFTGKGLLAMAKTYDDTNDSQFFVTEVPTRWLDFNHTIFGQLVEGESARDKISNVATLWQVNPNTGQNENTGSPLSPVVMNSVTVIPDKQNGVLSLSIPTTVTSGSATVTVTAKDPAGNQVQRTFTVTFAGDNTNDPPILQPIADVSTRANTPVTFQMNATDVDGGGTAYLNWVGLYNNFYSTGVPVRLLPPDNLSPYSPTRDIDVAVDFNTGFTTVTPRNNVAGVFPLYVGVATDLSAFDSQIVPLFISPAAPASIDLLDAADTGISATDNLTRYNNASPAGRLQFRVDGVLAGAEVQLFDGAASIGQAIVPAGATSVTIATSGASAWGNGPHGITAVQTLRNLAYSVGNRSGTTTLASLASPALGVTVDATAPTVAAPVFQFQAPAHALVYAFSENVSASLAAADLNLVNNTTGAATPAGSIHVAYNAAGNQATLTFPGYPGGTLPDGNYRATLAAAGVTDAAGNPLSAASVFDFFALAGDVDRDRAVGFADLLAVAQNYDRTGMTFAQGDLDGDGAVGFADLLAVAQNYDHSLTAPAEPVPAAPEPIALAMSLEPTTDPGIDEVLAPAMTQATETPESAAPDTGPAAVPADRRTAARSNGRKVPFNATAPLVRRPALAPREALRPPGAARPFLFHRRVRTWEGLSADPSGARFP